MALLLGLASASPAPAREPAVLMVLGDSLSIGYGLEPGQSWPERMAALLAEGGEPVRLVNSSVSGDTMDDGRARLGWALAEEPDVCVVALGGNDGLRMLDTGRMADALDAILGELEERGIDALVAGMLPPPNFGPEYAERFAAVFREAAAQRGVPLVPFLLEGVAGNPALNQPDGIHPNAEGAQLVARHMLPAVRALLERDGG
ncbi:MAG: arylesterase [Desulfovibrionaceae bacterium]